MGKQTPRLIGTASSFLWDAAHILPPPLPVPRFVRLLFPSFLLAGSALAVVGVGVAVALALAAALAVWRSLRQKVT